MSRPQINDARATDEGRKRRANFDPLLEIFPKRFFHSGKPGIAVAANFDRVSHLLLLR
jgi:hypothetical protein